VLCTRTLNAITSPMRCAVVGGFGIGTRERKHR